MSKHSTPRSADLRMSRIGASLAAGAVLCGGVVGACLIAQTARADEGDPYALPARGVVRPVNQATVATDMQVRVAEIGFKEGARFKAGDVLVEFDCRRYRAELSAAEAQRREAELTLENNLLLNQHRAIGKHEVEVSRVRVDKAAGEADSLKARVEDCRLVAPFSGRVAELGIHVFETVTPGKPFITLIDDNQLEIELIVPSDWLRWLKIGEEFAFHIDELKFSLPARVNRIGAAVDPVSQTIKVIAQFKDSADLAKVLAGMSGAAEFSPGKG